MSQDEQSPTEPIQMELPLPAAPAKKRGRPKGSTNKAKPKLPDKPIDIPDDHPALASEPDPRIDAEARAIAEAEARSVQVRRPGTREEIEQQIQAARAKPTQEYTPPKPTERQAAKIAEEIAAGQRRLAYFQEQERRRQQIAPDPNDPPNVKVFRPADHVPDINSLDPARSSQNLK